jgi:hypothetical protein
MVLCTGRLSYLTKAFMCCKLDFFCLVNLCSYWTIFDGQLNKENISIQIQQR